MKIITEVMGLEGTETDYERMERIGLKTAARKVKGARDAKRKLAIAYEHYRFVKQEKIDAYNERLRKATEKKAGYRKSWKTLSFTPLADYQEVPPGHVIEALEVAHNRGCFDAFEVAHIVKVEDPILFGRIRGCPDRFFIAQWDDDVKIEDILKENEG